MTFFAKILALSFFLSPLGTLLAGTIDFNEIVQIQNSNKESRNIEVKLNSTAISELEGTDHIEIKSFPFPDGSSGGISLSKIRNIAESDVITYFGNERKESPDISTFKGKLVSEDDSFVLMTIINGKINLIIESEAGNSYLSQSLKNTDNYIISDSRIDQYPRYTNLYDSPDDLNEIMELKYGRLGNEKHLSDDLLELELALETDSEVFKAQGNDAERTEAYILTLLTRVSLLYEEYINLRIKLTWLKIWGDSPVDPYGAEGNFATLRDKAVEYWEQNYSDVERDLFHVCTSISYGGGGFGYFNALCGNKKFGMSVSSLQGANDLMSPDFSYDVYIMAHELGHNFNAQHTHSCFWDDQPLDTCIVDNNCLPQGSKPKPNPGSIMSYCGGINNQSGLGYYVDLKFRDENVAIMRQTAESAECISVVTEPSIVLLEPGGKLAFNNPSEILIKWNSANIDKIDIYYSIDGGENKTLIESKVDASLGQFSWMPEELCSSDVGLYLIDSENDQIVAASDIPFSIIKDDPDGLVAYYPLDGDSRDHQFCHLFDADEVGELNYANDRNGNEQSAIEINSGNYLEVPIFNSPIEELTVALWYFAESGNGSQHLIGTDWQQQWIFSIYLWGQIGTSLYLGGNGAPDQIWAGNIESKKWTFLALTFDGYSAKIYVNGELTADKSYNDRTTLNQFASSKLYIGSRNGKDNFDGKIDDIRIYKRALNDEEIIELYSTVSSVSDIDSEDNYFEVSPNPAHDRIRFSLAEIEGNEISAEIYDIQGNLIASPSSDFLNQERTGVLDISYLPAGSYRILVRFGAKFKIGKFIKI